MLSAVVILVGVATMGVEASGVRRVAEGERSDNNTLIGVGFIPAVGIDLHLNVPPQEQKHLQKYRKLGWMFGGLLAPELALWNAWEQRREARRLSVPMREEGYMHKKTHLWPWT